MIRTWLCCLIISSLYLGESMAGTLPDWRDYDNNDVGVYYPAGLKQGQKSPAFVNEPRGNGNQIPGFGPVPAFSVNSTGQSVATLPVPAGTSLYGEGLTNTPQPGVGADGVSTPENAVIAPLLRNNSVTTLYNKDNYMAMGLYNNNLFLPNSNPLYQSIPWVLGVASDGKAFGVFSDTTWSVTISLSTTIQVASDGPPFRVIVIRENSPQEVIKRMATFTGTADLPALWTLGYNQSRYSYTPFQSATENPNLPTTLKGVADKLRKDNIPCDTMWMDIGTLQSNRVFTFDTMGDPDTNPPTPPGYPDPTGVYSYLHNNNFHAVNIMDCHIFVDPTYGNPNYVDPITNRPDPTLPYPVYDAAENQKLFVLNSDGITDFQGPCWPGNCSWLDFTMPASRGYWAKNVMQFLLKYGSGADGVWNDMNEPSVFTTLGTIPPDAIHRGGGDLPAGPQAQYHNVYGTLQTIASREGMLRARPERRPFVLTRAGSMGVQRYAEMWCGDNASQWNYFESSVPQILNVGMSMEPYAGCDIPGYAGPREPNSYNFAPVPPDLAARWFGVGAFYPFCRGHAESGAVQKEPWAFGTAVENEARMALQRRYRLLPYYYTLAQENSVEGMPIMRPVFFADTTDLSLRGEQESFLIGSDLLVVAHLKENETPQSHGNLPKGIWNSFTLVGEDPAHDVNQPDIRARGGSIIPIGPVMQFTGQKPLDPLTLIVSLDDKGKASGRLYEDAGDGFGYKLGLYRLTEFTVKKSGKGYKFSSKRVDGGLPEVKRTVEIVLLNGGSSQIYRLNAASQPNTGNEMDLQ